MLLGWNNATKCGTSLIKSVLGVMLELEVVVKYIFEWYAVQGGYVYSNWYTGHCTLRNICWGHCDDYACIIVVDKSHQFVVDESPPQATGLSRLDLPEHTKKRYFSS